MSSKKHKVFVSRDCAMNDVEQRKLAAYLENLERQRQTSLKYISHQLHVCKEDYSKMRRDKALYKVSESRLNQVQKNASPAKGMLESSVLPSSARIGHKCSGASKCNHGDDQAINKISQQIKDMERMLQSAAHSNDPEEIRRRLDRARRIVLNLRTAREKRLADNKTARSCTSHVVQADRVLCAIKSSSSSLAGRVKLSCVACEQGLSTKSDPSLSRYSSKTSATSAALPVSRGASATQSKRSAGDKETHTVGKNRAERINTNVSHRRNTGLSNQQIRKRYARSKSAPSGVRRQESAPSEVAPPDNWLVPDVSAIGLQERSKAHARATPKRLAFKSLNFDRLADYMVFGADGLRLTDLEADARVLSRKPDQPVTHAKARKQCVAVVPRVTAVSPFVNDEPYLQRPHTAATPGSGRQTQKTSPPVRQDKRKLAIQQDEAPWRQNAVTLRNNVTETCVMCEEDGGAAIARLEENRMDYSEKVQKFLASLQPNC